MTPVFVPRDTVPDLPIPEAEALVRVVVEASGIYSVDLCHALSEADGIEVMVANPRATKDFCKAPSR